MQTDPNTPSPEPEEQASVEPVVAEASLSNTFELPEEAPVLRSFGNAGAQSKAAKSERVTRAAMVAGGLAIVAVAAFLLYPTITLDSAPAFDPAAAGFQNVEPAEPVPVAETTLASPAVDVAAAVAVPAEEEAGLKAIAFKDACAQGLVPNSSNNIVCPAIEPAAPIVVLQVFSLDDFRDGAAPTPTNMEEALDQIKQLKAFLPVKDVPQPPEQVAKKKVRKIVAKPVEPVEYVSVSILDISPDRVIVSNTETPGVKIAVMPGSSLPGGATFIGFDPVSRLMKTDQGDFPIP